MTDHRLMIIGASGFLGQHLTRLATGSFKVFGADLTAPTGSCGLAMDVTSARSVDEGFRQVAPKVVVLLAALSDIDQCEQHREVAQAVNVRGAVHVAEACGRSGARLVFTSSAAVFDGTQHGYHESDAPSPVSVYGRTKARAEELISAKLPSALILRLALVLGFAEGAGTNAMLNRFAAKLRAGQPVALPDFEYRNPIDADTLSRVLLELVGLNEAAGIFHVGATEPISRFDLGVKLAQKMDLPGDLVQRQTQPLPGRAPRGLDHFLLTERLRAIGHTPVPTCEEVIERAIYGSPQSSI